MQYFVRLGVLGHVGRFRPVDALHYERGDRVVVRSARGLEVGEVLSASDADAGAVDGDLLRAMSVEDDLLAARLERNRNEAYVACVERLDRHQSSAVLMEVEHLFDGKSLFFHFLGEVPIEVERLTQELAEAYEAKAKFKQFSETLSEGCGPGCGTEEAKGQGGCVSCSGCAVAGACGPRQ